MKRLSKLQLVLWLLITLCVFSPLLLSFEYYGYHWGKRTVYWNYSESGSPITNTHSSIYDASSTWSSAGANFTFYSTAESPGGCHGDEPEEDGLIRWTTQSYPGATQITKYDGYIIKYVKTWLNKNDRWSTTGESDKLDLQSVMTHEFGHWLELGDVYSPRDAVMYAYIDDGEIRRNLSQDDINGIVHIYGTGASSAKIKLSLQGDRRIWEFVDGQLFKTQNGCLDFYYCHDLELRWILDDNPDLKSKAYKVAKSFAVGVYELLTKEGTLREDAAGPRLSKSDVAKIIGLMRNIREKASKELATDIEKFIRFMKASIGKCYADIFRAAMNREKLNKPFDLEGIFNQMESFNLAQNYPNPFNAETIIVYQLPDKSHVRIRIYDLRGREVISLVDREEPSGYYSILWDGKNWEGKRVASGIYIYRIDTERFSMAKKMILIQ